MVVCHPNLLTNDVNLGLEDEIKRQEFKGHISRDSMVVIFRFLSWHFLGGYVEQAFTKNSALKQVLLNFNLLYIEDMNIYEATVFLYKSMAEKYDMRVFCKGELKGNRPGTNKLLEEKDFYSAKLFEEYAKGKYDVSEDFLLLNDVFTVTRENSTVKMSNMSDIVKTKRLHDLADKEYLKFKIASKQLDIREHGDVLESKKTLYILQDCSMSMKNYVGSIHNLKAYILDTAAKNDYKVEWLYVTDKVHKTEVYKDSTDIMGYGNFYRSKVNLSSIISDSKFTDKNIVIITDGTDDFNFPIMTRTKKIHLVYFINNITLKHKFTAYGKTFKAFK